VAVVGGEGVDLAPVRVAGEGIVASLLDPEVAVETALEVGGLLLELVGERGVLPEKPRQAGAPHFGVVGVALQLAGGAREARQRAVVVGDRVPRILPALVLEAGLLVAPLVPDVAVAHEVGVLVDPGQSGARFVFQLAHQLRVAGPALVLVEQHHVERRRVHGAVVRRVRAFFERRHLAVPHLVQDAARILVAEVVAAAALAFAELAQRGGRELGRERQRLQAREDAVAAEHGHEPREAGGRQTAATGGPGREAQGREVDQAARVDHLQPLPVGLQRRRVVEPLLKAVLLVGPRTLGVTLVLGLVARLSPGGAGGDHVQVGGPLAVRLDVHPEREPGFVHLARRRRRDPRLTVERLALVAEHQTVALDAAVVGALLLQRVLDLEQVGEIAGGLHADLEIDRFLVVIEERELLVEAVAHGALADHRELGVDVDGARSRHQEEARLEVLQVVGRKRIEALAVDGEHPLREEARVEREQPGGVGERGLDITARVADHERVALEDLDQVVAHVALLA
jgi:hypothetical protein